MIPDIGLSGMDGWTVLGMLKEDVRTRHIPVHVVSVEEPTTESRSRGAIGHAVKPLNAEELEQTFRRLEQVAAEHSKRVLVVEDDPEIRHATVALVASADTTVDEAATGAEAMTALRAENYDCPVLDLRLPDMDGNELLTELEREGVELPPVIVHTARDLSRDEENRLREHAQSVLIKDVRSQE